MKKIVLLLIMTNCMLLAKAQVDLYNDVKGACLNGSVKKMTTLKLNYKKDASDSLVIDKSECYVMVYNYSKTGQLSKRSAYHDKSGTVKLLSDYNVTFENGRPVSGTYTNDAGNTMFTTIYKHISDTSYAIADVDGNMNITNTLIVKKNESGLISEEVTLTHLENNKEKQVVRKKIYRDKQLVEEHAEGYIIGKNSEKFDKGTLTIDYTIIEKDTKGNPVYVVTNDSNGAIQLTQYIYEYYE